jgi:uncharacterized iron-regulated membrane protein
MTLQRVLAAIVATLLLAGAVVMGAVLAALFLGLALVGAAVFMGRIWWLRRKLRQQPPPFEAPAAEQRAVIDAEFHVVEPDAAADSGATKRSPAPRD